MNVRLAISRLAAVAVLIAVAGCVHQPPHGAAAAAGGTARPIAGITWRWVGTVTPVEVFTPVIPADYTLELRADGRAAVRADCNRGSGPYRLDDTSLTLGPFATTLAMCPSGSLGDRYLKQLGGAAHAFWRGDTLLLDLKSDSGTMRFLPAP